MRLVVKCIAAFVAVCFALLGLPEFGASIRVMRAAGSVREGVRFIADPPVFLAYKFMPWMEQLQDPPREPITCPTLRNTDETSAALIVKRKEPLDLRVLFAMGCSRPGRYEVKILRSAPSTAMVVKTGSVQELYGWRPAFEPGTYRLELRRLQGKG